MAVVYIHKRNDTNNVFYVGIGNSKYRATSKTGRSEYWKRIVNKHGREVEIIAKDLTWADACELEIFLIKEYGRLDLKTGNLVNMTDGGEGMSNPSKETRAKLSKSKMGNTNTLGFKHSEETKRKVSESRLGVKLSKEHCEAISKGKIGTILSDEHRANLSKANKGRISPMKDKKMSNESRLKMSNTRKGVALSENHKESISKSNKGRVFSEEHKANLRKPKKKKTI